MFYENYLQRKKETDCKTEKTVKKKTTTYMYSGKIMIIKSILLYKMSYSPEHVVIVKK